MKMAEVVDSICGYSIASFVFRNLFLCFWEEIQSTRFQQEDEILFTILVYFQTCFFVMEGFSSLLFLLTVSGFSHFVDLAAVL